MADGWKGQTDKNLYKHEKKSRSKTNELAGPKTRKNLGTSLTSELSNDKRVVSKFIVMV